MERVDAGTIRLERDVVWHDLLALAECDHPILRAEEDPARPLHHDFRTKPREQGLVELSA